MRFGGFEKCTLIDYPGKVACMVYTIGCPFRCPYCHNPELVDETCSTFFEEGDVLSFLSTRKGMLDGIVITGGEPSIHGQELISFMKEVKKLGFLVKLDSNGVDPDFLQEVIAKNLVDYIAMDIKAPLMKYSQVVGRPVAIEKIRKSIALIMSGPIAYEFRTTIVKSMITVEDLKQIGQEIRGAQIYYLQKFIPSKILNPQFLKKVTYGDEEFSGIKTMMEDYVTVCDIR